MKHLKLTILILALLAVLALCLGACNTSNDDDNRDDDDDDDVLDDDDDDDDDDEGCPDADQTNLGHDEDKTMADWTLPNHQGDEISLYDRYCGSIVVILVGAGNCPYCGQEADAFQGYYDEYKDDGVDLVVVMGGNFSGGTPTEGFLDTYKERHGLDDVEVLGDTNYSVTGPYFPDNGIPMTIFLRRDMEIGYIVLGWSDAMIEGKIKRMLVEDE
ncbi:MAG: redoxin domain-containing protein [Candidatus Alcyoniella australis]|nr:redoxin domain-containing protein [Candidatus Alcyoniella australis]